PDRSCADLGSRRDGLRLRHRHAVDLALQVEEAPEEGFRARWTAGDVDVHGDHPIDALRYRVRPVGTAAGRAGPHGDRKSTRLNSSHANISYAVFCLKK